jgi:predicted CXXCH cytochrome family protein
MKTISKLASGLALVAISGSAFATDGIGNTKHNLGAGGLGNHTDATTEICVFCHTPHNANQSASAPLWNREFNTVQGYSRYSSLGTTTFDAAESAVGSVSIACLSCHDGTQAMDAMLNAPGSGNGHVDSVTVNSLLGEGGSGGHGGWTETNMMSTFGVGINDNGNSGDSIYLGTDLRNDHPISMQYGGGGINNSATNGATTDPSYSQVEDHGGVGTAGVSTAIGGTGSVKTRVLATGQRVWWVDNNGDSTQQKNDFTLFTRGTGATAEPLVECATCHDPHSTNSTFLRLTSNAGSTVCLTCHTK